MATSPIFIRAAEDGIADARQRGSTAVFSFGMEAVRNCGHQHRRATASQMLNDRDPTSVACFIIASIPNENIVHLLSFITVNLPREGRARSLISSSAFKERFSVFGEDIKPLLARKIGAIGADILISYAHKINAAKMARMKKHLDVYSKKLNELKQLAAKANEDVTKKNIVIDALLDCRAHDEASRSYDEGICVYTETLINSLGELAEHEANLSEEPRCA